MLKNNFSEIDLVIANFYPVEEVLSKTNNHSKIIENIDIGGTTLVRAAAKNYKYVTVITDPEFCLFEMTTNTIWNTFHFLLFIKALIYFSKKER